ncbi:MAG: hypothetical protein ACW98X_06605 [Promethearchaeota archaeon]|jgi:hypothetical protein
MNVSLRYHEILEENLVLELEWLSEEFELLFSSKKEKHSELDKKIANDIIDHILEKFYPCENDTLLSLMNDSLKDIEKKYVNLL